MRQELYSENPFESKRSNDLDEQEWLYRESNISGKVIDKKIALVEQKLASETEPILNEDSFYLNSSDSLRAIDKSINSKKKRVLCVAGSGDFAQLFFAQGATSVMSFDISPFAACWSELKVRAVEHLSLAEYERMFHSFLTKPVFRDDDVDYAEPTPLFDMDLFEKISPFLSSVAVSLFHQLAWFHPRLFKLDEVSGGCDGFARPRSQNTVGDVVRSEEQYAAMQGHVRNGKYRVSVQDAGSAAKHSLHEDIAYISNIGYHIQYTVEEAAIFKSKGIQKVCFSFCPNDIYEMRHTNANRFPIAKGEQIRIGEHVIKVLNIEEDFWLEYKGVAELLR